MLSTNYELVQWAWALASMCDVVK